MCPRAIARIIVGPICYAIHVDPSFAISVRRARPDDAPALAALVNRAYAVEEFFVDGDRTTAGEIEQLIRTGTFLVLERGPILAAAVYVDTHPVGASTAPGTSGYIGMLSVEPSLQGMGLGKRLVRIAEAMCEAMGASSVHLRVVNLREELARWYRGLGYREVGTSPFDGTTKQPCHYIEMHKWLPTASTSATVSAAVA